MPDLTPDKRARQEIDAQLAAAGWFVQNYLLLVDRPAVGVVEVKKVGSTLSKGTCQTSSFKRPFIESGSEFLSNRAFSSTSSHWAAHGQTAAEVIHSRASAAKPKMGMTNWFGTKPSKAEAVVAKSYLAPDELNALNRIVTAYLELAELQALNRKSMYMRDWIEAR